MVNEVRGSVGFPYRTLQRCWSVHNIAPDARLQLSRNHQPLLPMRPGEPGIAYTPSWFQQAEIKPLPLVMKTGSDKWTFCGMYQAELVDIFKPVVWDKEPDEVSHNV